MSTTLPSSVLNQTLTSVSYLSGAAMGRMMYMFSARHADRFEAAEYDSEPEPQGGGRIIGDNQGKKTSAPPTWRRDMEGDRTAWGYYIERAPPVVSGGGLEGPDVFVADEAENEFGVSGIQAGERRRRILSAPSVHPHVPALVRSLTHTPTTPRPSSSSRVNMAVATYWWISLWFALTAPVIAWDVGYCFMRPRSMVGGDLHWIWEPYGIYQNVDYIYGIKALEEGSGFTNAQSFMNVVETLLNLYYVYLAHGAKSPTASLVGFSAALMTLSKTVLYWLQEYYCNYCAVGHNTLYDFVVYWLIPNGFWIVIPTLILFRLGKDISGQLQLAAKVSSGKTQ